MRRKDAERAEARRLRAEGRSVKGIAADLGVAVSSVSVWVRDVPKSAPPPPAEAPDPRPEEAERYCSACDRFLSLSAFNRAGDGHQHWCRECFKAYFRERGERHREQTRAARERRREVARAYLGAYLRDHPCVDCGEDEVFVLEFDHCRGTKSANIAELLAAAAKLERIEREVALCEVVCVNCHRRRTASRMGAFRATGVAPSAWNASQRRNQAHLLEVLRSSGCVDCGERDPVVLEFDHVGVKRAMVTRLAQWCSLATVEAEIARCVVRCANCHRLKSLTTAAGCWREEDHWAESLHIADPTNEAFEPLHQPRKTAESQ